MDAFPDEIRALAPKGATRFRTVDDLAEPPSGLVEPTAQAGQYDAIFVELRPGWKDAHLAHWRSQLADRGRLVLRIPHSERSRERGRLVQSLSGLGFVLVHDQPEADSPRGPHLLAARRDDYRIRAYAEGDEHAILELFAPSFHAVRSPEHWRWKFLANPWGRLQITLAWSPEGQLAAHYAGYPVPWCHHDPHGRRTDFEAIQVGDTMTHPAHRSVGRGPTSLLVRSVRHFYARWCEQQVAFNFGFNTGNIRKFSLRYVRAQALEPVSFWRKDAGSVDRASRAESRDHRESLDYRVSELGRSDLEIPANRSRLWGSARELDLFFDRAAPAYGTLVRRDAAWLLWRYLRCPDQPAFFLLAARRGRRLVGWSVFRRRENRLTWCDALFLPGHESASRALLAAALDRPDMQGIEAIEAWFSPRPAWWLAELESQGFESLAEPNDLALLFVPHARDDAPEILSRAYYTMGDGDLA